MKSFAIALVGGFATLASASPDYTKTVTITEPCEPSTASQGQYSQGGYGDAGVTVTVTKTYPPQTVTETVTYGNPGSSTITSYSQGNGLPPSHTYTYSSTHYSNTTTTAAGAHKTHHVDVGTFGGVVKFVPNTVDAAIGDVVEYNFLAKSHSLTQSDFKTPCTYNGGFDTGLNQANPNNITRLHVVPFTVSTTSPQCFYFKQQGPPNHCGKGMVFGLNPGSQAKMDQFVANAIAQNGNLTGTASSTAAVTSATSSSTSTSTAAPITVTVGLDAGKTLKFSPPYLSHVPRGSKVHFDFRALNHTLTESSLENPCTKLNPTAIDTNFANFNPMDMPGLKTFDLEVTGDEPRFFYCKQANRTPKGHCAKGMVFGLNVDEETFGRFEANAEATAVKVKSRSFRA